MNVYRGVLLVWAAALELGRQRFAQNIDRALKRLLWTDKDSHGNAPLLSPFGPQHLITLSAEKSRGLAKKSARRTTRALSMSGYRAGSTCTRLSENVGALPRSARISALAALTVLFERLSLRQ